MPAWRTDTGIGQLIAYMPRSAPGSRSRLYTVATAARVSKIRVAVATAARVSKIRVAVATATRAYETNLFMVNSSFEDSFFRLPLGPVLHFLDVFLEIAHLFVSELLEEQPIFMCSVWKVSGTNNLAHK